MADSIVPEVPFNSYTANGVSNIFPYQFTLLSLGDLVVTVNGVTMTSGFAVSNIGAQGGGNIIFNVAPTNGDTIFFLRSLAARRDTDYQYNGDFQEQTVDRDFNRIWQYLQGVSSQIGSGIRLPYPEQAVVLPPAAQRANTSLVFDGTGQPTIGVPISGSAADVLIQLANSVLPGLGAGLVSRGNQVVSSIAALRLLSKTSQSKFAFVTGYYVAYDGGGGQYALDVADVVSADNGGTTIAAADGGRWKLASSGVISVKAFGVKGDNSTNDTAAMQAAITALPGRALYIPKGTYLLNALDLRGWFGTITGDGQQNTVLKARQAVTDFININEAADTVLSSFTISNLAIDGNAFAQNGYAIRFRHNTLLENVNVYNCLAQGGWEKDAFLGRHVNVRYNSNARGLRLVGSNHSTSFYGCTFSGSTLVQVLIENLGTALDGNDSLLFSGCDIEFGAGSSGGADISCTSCTFETCYVGENITGPVITVRAGRVTGRGGVFFYGFTATSFAFQPLGGRTEWEKHVMNGQTFSSASMMSTGTGGSFLVKDMQLNGTLGGGPFLVGDVLDYGPQGTVYAARLGKTYTGQALNATFSTTTVGNAKTLTCLTAPGPTPYMGFNTPILGLNTWRDGEPLYLVIVYESSKPLNVAVSSGFGGTAPLILIATGLPATSGTPNTAICTQLNWSANAYTLFEVLQQSTAVADTLKLYEVFLTDSRFLNKGAGQLGNLYKC